MKLIYCKECNAIFSLSKEMKYCDCRKAYGRYYDNLIAIYGGSAIPLGINNKSFHISLMKYVLGKATEFIAFTIDKSCDTYKRDIK